MAYDDQNVQLNDEVYLNIVFFCKTRRSFSKIMPD